MFILLLVVWICMVSEETRTELRAFGPLFLAIFLPASFCTGVLAVDSCQQYRTEQEEEPIVKPQETAAEPTPLQTIEEVITSAEGKEFVVTYTVRDDVLYGEFGGYARPFGENCVQTGHYHSSIIGCLHDDGTRLRVRAKGSLDSKVLVDGPVDDPEVIPYKERFDHVHGLLAKAGLME